jgi:hypothetical protein
MGLNFPSAPAVGETYPTPALPGVPQWTWNGTTWKATNVDTSSYVLKSGDRMTGRLVFDNNVGLAWDADQNTAIMGNAAGHTIIFYTGNAGRMYINDTGVLPAANGTLNLGAAAQRWGTVFTSDLDLNNGIGDWTIVEGEDDLFLYNNKRDKVYKFALTEVDPSAAPPKKA